MFRDGHAHAGVLLLDDAGDPMFELRRVRDSLSAYSVALAAGAFLRIGLAETSLVTPG